MKLAAREQYCELPDLPNGTSRCITRNRILVTRRALPRPDPPSLQTPCWTALALTAIATPISGYEHVESIKQQHDTGDTAEAAHLLQILDGLSLKINPGERVAIVGPSGSGKSTILKLLARSYDPQQGSVLVEGLDVKDLRQESLRSALAVVPQDTVLFNDTIAENIRCGPDP